MRNKPLPGLVKKQEKQKKSPISKKSPTKFGQMVGAGIPGMPGAEMMGVGAVPGAARRRRQ